MALRTGPHLHREQYGPVPSPCLGRVATVDMGPDDVTGSQRERRHVCNRCAAAVEVVPGPPPTGDPTRGGGDPNRADTGPTRGRHGADTGSTRGRHGADTGPTRGRHGADTGPTRGRHGADTGPTRGRHVAEVRGRRTRSPLHGAAPLRRRLAQKIGRHQRDSGGFIGSLTTASANRHTLTP